MGVKADITADPWSTLRQLAWRDVLFDSVMGS